MTRSKTRGSLPRSDENDDVFRRQHQLRTTGEREINGMRRSVLLNEGESPLGWLKSRKDRNGNPLISEPQYEAGERLRADHFLSYASDPAYSVQTIALALQTHKIWLILGLYVIVLSPWATLNRTAVVALLLPREDK
jgi:hypothetical protein